MDDLKLKVAASISIKKLIEDKEGESPANLIICPFHGDKNPSAKFFEDDDGVDRLWCFACKKQYTSYEYLILIGKNPKDYVKEGVEVKEHVIKAADYTYFDKFKTGEIGIEQYLNALLEL